MKIIISIFILVFLSACGSTEIKKEVVVKKEQVKTDIVMIQLKDAINSIQNDVNDLKLLEQAKNPNLTNQMARHNTKSIPEELQEAVSEPWESELAEFVCKMAKRANYRCYEIGPKPVRPIIIYTGKEYRRIFDHLQDAGSQAGENANVVVRDNGEVLIVYISDDLRYKTAKKKSIFGQIKID